MNPIFAVVWGVLMAIGIIKKKKPDAEIKMLDYDAVKDRDMEKIIEKVLDEREVK